MRLLAPTETLTDTVVRLRTPVPADAAVLARFAGEVGGMEGIWLPLAQGADLAQCEALVADWLAGWAARPSCHGPTLVVETRDFGLVGHVGFVPRGAGVVELGYGIAPAYRGRGLASRAARVGARWLAAQPGVDVVEVRIDAAHQASLHVARSAGFEPAGTVRQAVAATGESFEDVRMVFHVH